jgi:dynein heavy chain
MDSSTIAPVPESELVKLKAHYNWSMYQALLGCTKNSLKVLKSRMSVRASGKSSPMFEVGLQLDGIGVRLSPSLEEIQRSVNEGALAILKCSKMVQAWNTVERKETIITVQGTFYDRIVQDKEILKSILLLTGAIQSSRGETSEYLNQFASFSWMWRLNICDSYKDFAKSGNVEAKEFEKKLREFAKIQETLEFPSTQIAALLIKTDSLTKSLKILASQWSVEFSKELHKEARRKLEMISERIKQTMKRMLRPVEIGDIDALNSVMNTLSDVRRQQSNIDLEFSPIFSMYALLDQYLPSSLFDKDEQDTRSMLRSNWAKLVEESNRRQAELSAKQDEYKKTLVATIIAFKKDVKDLRILYEEKGPMVAGIEPREAVERLKRFKEEFEVRSRKQEMYKLGEDLFGLPNQLYPQLDLTKKELGYLSQLVNSGLRFVFKARCHFRFFFDFLLFFDVCVTSCFTHNNSFL